MTSAKNGRKGRPALIRWHVGTAALRKQRALPDGCANQQHPPIAVLEAPGFGAPGVNGSPCKLGAHRFGHQRPLSRLSWAPPNCLGGFGQPAGSRRRRSSARPYRSRGDPRLGRSTTKACAAPGAGQPRSSFTDHSVRERRRKRHCRRSGKRKDENSPLSSHACRRARPVRRPHGRDARRRGSHSRFRQCPAGRLDVAGVHHLHRRAPRRFRRDDRRHCHPTPGGRELPPFHSLRWGGCYTIHIRPGLRFPRVPLGRPHRQRRLCAGFRESDFAKFLDPHGQVRNHLWRPGQRRRADRRGQSELHHFFGIPLQLQTTGGSQPKTSPGTTTPP